jgi:hypothetical protein
MNTKQNWTVAKGGTDGRTHTHTKKGASPTPPKPVLGFTTLGHTYEHVCIYLRTGTTTSPH